jgi:hypothetical protein
MQRRLFVLNRRDVRHIRRPVDLLMPVTAQARWESRATIDKILLST